MLLSPPPIYHSEADADGDPCASGAAGGGSGGGRGGLHAAELALGGGRHRTARPGNPGHRRGGPAVAAERLPGPGGAARLLEADVTAVPGPAGPRAVARRAVPGAALRAPGGEHGRQPGEVAAGGGERAVELP